MIALCSPQPVSIVPNAKLTFAGGPHPRERNVIHGRFHSPAYVQSLGITMQCARRGARRCTDPTAACLALPIRSASYLLEPCIE